MTRASCGISFFAALAVLVGNVTANAAVLSDFSNFARTGQYVAFDGATFTSGATDFRIQSPGDFGGMFKDLVPPVDGSGNHQVELQLDINPANVAPLFNVVLVDNDGTERVYRWSGLTAGLDQTLTRDLTDFLQDNNPGTIPGLQISGIRQFHFQGSFTNGNPGLAMDVTLDNLALVPEPTSFVLVIVGLALAAFRRRRAIG